LRKTFGRRRRAGGLGTSVDADIVGRVSDALELTIRFEAGDTAF